MSQHITFNTGYFDRAFDSLPEIIETAKRKLARVDFDTIVGTGFSGGVVIPALAMALEKRYMLIRKETDDSHHGPGRAIGSLGKRWIFLDDFVSSGATRRRVVEKVGAACVMHDFTTTYVGDYMYARSEQPGDYFDNKATDWGVWTPFEEFGCLEFAPLGEGTENERPWNGRLPR